MFPLEALKTILSFVTGKGGDLPTVIRAARDVLDWIVDTVVPSGPVRRGNAAAIPAWLLPLILQIIQLIGPFLKPKAGRVSVAKARPTPKMKAHAKKLEKFIAECEEA
jgi:hypothetical protein